MHGLIAALHLQIGTGQIKRFLKIGRIGLHILLQLLEACVGLAGIGAVFFPATELIDGVNDRTIVRVKLETGFGDRQGVIEALYFGAEQKVHIAEHCFRAVWT